MATAGACKALIRGFESHPSLKKEKKMAEPIWKCKYCGFFHIGAEAPEECPGCGETDSFERIREKSDNPSNDEVKQEKMIEVEERKDSTNEDPEE